jgi:quinol monooxygenase YgiN
MITRIVRMEFHPQNVDAFLKIFDEGKPVISVFKGCREVRLFSDANHPFVYYTISQWDTEDELNAYRSSEFFEDTWKKTKALFSAKPIAYSLQNV